MFALCVRVSVKPEHVPAFLVATADNQANTRREPANLRFDVLRRHDDPSRFLFYEVYRDEAGFKSHQQTAHYLRWREAVAPFMAEPRSGDRYETVQPDPYS